MKQNNIRKHSLFESLLFHLLPGILIGAVYYLIVPAIQSAGYPSVMALILIAIFVLVPIELGILLWQGKGRNGKLSLKGIVLYRGKLAWHQYLLWIVVIFISSGLIMTVLNPVSAFIEGWFKWIPENLRLGMGLSDTFSRSKLIQTYALHFIFIVIVAPLIEELYFRGFLLPRMPEKLGWSGPLVHSVLFALYHTWSPWMFLARTLALLPLIYVVRWKKNIFLGIGAHWLINSIDFVMGVIFILAIG
jgi:membrane protease YdiL (CAAX protease family)